MNNLNINIKESFDCRTIIVEDTSIYDNIQEIDNPILEIKPPGKDCFVEFPLYKNWQNKVLNCSLLKICCETCPASFNSLPDGIYELKYSINPNLKTIVEFSHMRVCKLMSSYMSSLGMHLSTRCSNDKSKNDSLKKEFEEIKDLIDSSKYAIEECSDESLGLELYNEASNRLNMINNGSFKQCFK